jgi:hypothetical protein
MHRLDETPGYPWTPFTEWRLRSRVCAVGDLIVVAVGAALFAVLGVDDVVSWRSDQVLVSHDRLIGPVAPLILCGCALWGPTYEISVRGVHDRAWTPVSAREYRHWQARFVRQDALAMIVGLGVALTGTALFSLHREAYQLAGRPVLPLAGGRFGGWRR